MKKVFSFIIILAILGCNGQSELNTVYFDKEFNWTIKLPKEYKKISYSEWTSKVEDGGSAIERNNDVTFENKTKPIFIFKIDSQNYFESTKMQYDTNKDGELKDYLREYNQIQFNTFKSERPDLKIDTLTTNINIDELTFEKHEMNVSYKNSTNTIIKIINYDRIFDEKLFSINVIYNDEKIGSKLIKEIESSKFK